ncbi:hypothetical protein [Mucilaginibacter sp. SP1R1]|uniref:hypothetical protein n=1 Tax=Mucilaginibacter sp. SP1R1 TaxID=2723091 RepID=UPI00160D2617|nr:hypothetical protein [Mucilaginibacter sp. SP1R1]MBB6149741.1 hypothetical protein [Mucilaginibacter sp. SP1R1]
MIINPKGIRFITFVAFVQIAIQIAFFYISVKGISLSYVRHPLSLLSIAAYLATIIYLLNILKFFGEKGSVLTAFKLYIGVELAMFAANTLSGILFNNYTYYQLFAAANFIAVLYLSIQIFTIKNPAIKQPFSLLGISLLVTSILSLVTPFLFTLINDYMIFSYVNLIRLIPIVATINIFNKVAEQLKTSATEEKDNFGLK